MRSRRRLGLLGFITAVVVMVVIVAAGLFVVNRVTGCGGGATRTDDDQCVGVTDGSDAAVFGDGLSDVLGRIGAENQAVTGSGRPFVSVVYMLPVPRPGSTDAAGSAQRHELVGAYVSQRQANVSAGDEPLLRVLVANYGDSAANWRDVVPQVVAMTSTSFSTDRVVGAVISGKSRTAAGEAVDALLAANVPVISSRLTAAQLTARPATADQPLVRVAPTNRDQTAAAAAYLRGTSRRAMIVQNSDQDDLYSSTLGATFRSVFPDATHTILSPTETYSARLGSVTNTMKGILRNVCQQRPDVVFFGGRAAELGALVAALPFRPCLSQRITIVTGSDAVDFVTATARGADELSTGLQANAEVVYTGLAHPGAWTRLPGSFNATSVRFLTGPCPGGVCLPSLFPGESMDDGGVILGYDTTLTAVTAVRSANGVNDTPGAVAQQFKRMHGTESVPGASGWISFTPSGESINKAVPLLRVRPDGALDFLELSAPRRTPCLPDGASC